MFGGVRALFNGPPHNGHYNGLAPHNGHFGDETKKKSMTSRSLTVERRSEEATAQPRQWGGGAGGKRGEGRGEGSRVRVRAQGKDADKGEGEEGKGRGEAARGAWARVGDVM